MSHLHRMRAANLAIAADPDTCHTCKPTIVRADEFVELEELAPSTSSRKRAPAKKSKASKRAKR